MRKGKVWKKTYLLLLIGITKQQQKGIQKRKGAYDALGIPSNPTRNDIPANNT